MSKLLDRKVRYSPVIRIAVARGELVLVTAHRKKPGIWRPVVARKYHTCIHCKEDIEQRDRMYRPESRSNEFRLCMGCIDAAREDGYVPQRV